MNTLDSFCIAVLVPFFAAAWGMAESPRADNIETIAGTGDDADDAQGIVALKTNIGQPFGVEIGPDGGLYITEVANHRVRRVDLASGRITTVAGSGEQGYAGDGGPATAALLNEPYEVRFDRQGHMYFVEMRNHIVRRVDKHSGQISTVAGTGRPGYSGDGGRATDAMLKNPHSIALDNDGQLYIADIGNHRIRRVDLRQGTIDSIAGNGKRELPQDGQQARENPLLGPRALFIEQHTMWIALREGHSIWRLDLKRGTLSHVAGTGRRGYTGDGGPGKSATFNGPKGIAVGPQGNVFVVDTENQAIRKIDRRSGRVSTVAGAGPDARGFAGDGGSATAAQLNRPHGICVGPDGAIYLGDTENHRVRRVQE